MNCVLTSTIMWRYLNSLIINAPQGDCKDCVLLKIKVMCTINSEGGILSCK